MTSADVRLTSDVRSPDEKNAGSITHLIFVGFTWNFVYLPRLLEMKAGVQGTPCHGSHFLFFLSEQLKKNGLPSWKQEQFSSGLTSDWRQPSYVSVTHLTTWRQTWQLSKRMITHNQLFIYWVKYQINEVIWQLDKISDVTWQWFDYYIIFCGLGLDLSNRNGNTRVFINRRYTNVVRCCKCLQ